MERSERWSRAKADTRGFVWRREVGIGAVAFPLTWVALELWGSEEGATDQLLVAAVTAVVVLGVFPVVEFGWNYVWAPWRVLQERVNEMHGRVLAQPSPPAPDAKFQAEQTEKTGKILAARLMMFRAFQNDLRTAKGNTEKALNRSNLSGFSIKREAWNVWGDTLAASPQLQGFYEEMRDFYEWTYELYIASGGAKSGEDHEKLKALLPRVESALSVVDAEIKKARVD